MSDRHYTTRSSVFDDRNVSVTADHIYLDDDRPERTGLLDANGLPIYRMRRRQPVGFQVRHEP